MKRLVWLLITVVCAALAQVQPVVSSATQDEPCCCTGEVAGACGMPDCAPAPAASHCAQHLPAVAVQRAEARQLSTAPKNRYENFYVRFESSPAARPAVGVSRPGTPAASVPLFKAHCSFLI